MSQYVVFEEGITTNAIAPFTEGGFIGNRQRLELLNENGIEELKEGEYYDLQSFLNAFKDLGEKIGEMNLFVIGKTVMEKVEFPPMENLEQALVSIDIAYHMSHKKNGKDMFDPSTGKILDGIGNYEVQKYDEVNRTAVVLCSTPYPSKFEEGILVQIVRLFKPKDSLRAKVTLDPTKETKRNGADTCTYIITW